MPDPEILLAWMAARGSVEISIRDIGEAAPRAFRRKAAFEPALEALLRSGVIVETSARPRMFRVAASDDAEPALSPPMLRAITIRRPDDAEIRGAIRRAYLNRRAGLSDAAALVEAVSAFRAELIEQAREAAGFPCMCPTCGTAVEMVDRSIVEALG